MSEAVKTLRTRPVAPGIGVEVLDVDLSGALDEELFAAIYRAFLAHQVLLFRAQALPPAAQVAFGRRFGELQIHVMNQYHASAHPELYQLSNLDAEGRPNGKHPDQGTLAWHTDGSWQRITGHATILYAEVIPSRGGATHFCDMYAAYEALPAAEQARLGRLRAIHSLDFSRNRRHGHEPLSDAQRARIPPVDHPVVRTHPETGRKALYLGDHAETIKDMDYAAGRALVDALNAAAVDARRVYVHHWQAGDVVVWDNRCLLHRATPYDAARERRVVRRCTVLGEVPQP